MTKTLEISIISKESIKPSSPVDHLEPFKLCLLDQLHPFEYSPLILFYTSNAAHNLGTNQMSTKLKDSLSKTLSSFYPLTGKIKDNISIHNFHEGNVPFTHARVKGRLEKFLESPQVEVLDQFLPCQPFCQVKEQTGPLLAVQLNIFDCGGIALGMCFQHKVMDGASMGSFLKAWAANARSAAADYCQDVVPLTPSLSEASMHFPPQEALPPGYTSFLDSWWNSDAKLTLRRFVFEAEAVDALKAEAKCEAVENPTKCEALSAFIWKLAMAATSKSISSSSPRPTVFTQAVNIRRLTEPRLPEHAFGNLYWQPFVKDNAVQATELDLHGLVALARQCVKKIDAEYLSKLSTAIFEYLDQLTENAKEDATFYNFHDMRTFPFNDMDFGWGKPVWVGVCGQGQDWNCTIFMNGKNGAIEVWMALEEKVMEELQQDPEFLTYARPNPGVL